MQQDNPKIVAENLKRYLRQQGTLQQAAERLGVGPTTVSNQLNGKAYFTRKNAVRYAAVFGVNADYLVTGQGEVHSDFAEPRAVYSMFPKGDSGASTVEDRIVIGIREQLRKLDEVARTYNNLTEHILDMAEYILPDSGYYEFCNKVKGLLEGREVKEVDPLHTL